MVIGDETLVKTLAETLAETDAGWNKTKEGGFAS